MIDVYVSRQIYDDPEDRDSDVIHCDSMYTFDEWLNCRKRGSLYDIDYIIPIDHIDKIEVIE